MTGVLITLLFRNLDSRTIPPGAITAIPLDRPASGQYVTFRGDVSAAVTSALVSYLLGKVQSRTYSWRTCIHHVTVACLSSNVATLAPRTGVHIGRYDVPLREILAAFGDVVEYAPLVSTVTHQNAAYVTWDSSRLNSDCRML